MLLAAADEREVDGVHLPVAVEIVSVADSLRPGVGPRADLVVVDEVYDAAGRPGLAHQVAEVEGVGRGQPGVVGRPEGHLEPGVADGAIIPGEGEPVGTVGPGSPPDGDRVRSRRGRPFADPLAVADAKNEV